MSPEFDFMAGGLTNNSGDSPFVVVPLEVSPQASNIHRLRIASCAFVLAEPRDVLKGSDECRYAALQRDSPGYIY